jgi:hypothetical protein
MERSVRGISTARNRFIGVVTPRTWAGLCDFAEAAVLAMIVQWGTKRLATMQRAKIADPNVVATD